MLLVATQPQVSRFAFVRTRSQSNERLGHNERCNPRCAHFYRLGEGCSSTKRVDLHWAVDRPSWATVLLWSFDWTLSASWPSSMIATAWSVSSAAVASHACSSLRSERSAAES